MWKLVSRFGSDWELYNMEADRTELDDLAERYPDVVQRLAREYVAWAEDAGVVSWDEMGQRLPPAYSVWIEPSR